MELLLSIGDDGQLLSLSAVYDSSGTRGDGMEVIRPGQVIQGISYEDLRRLAPGRIEIKNGQATRLREEGIPKTEKEWREFWRVANKRPRKRRRLPESKAKTRKARAVSVS